MTQSSGYIHISEKNAANGVAPLGSDRKVPLENLPQAVEEAVAAADSAIVKHQAASNPHPNYLLKAEKGVPGGVAPLDSSGLIPSTFLPTIANPNVSRFRVYKNATQSLLLSIWTKVAFQASTYDSLLEFNISTLRFVAKNAGLYLFSTALNLANSNSGTAASLAFYVNGSEFSRPTSFATANNMAFSVSAIQLLQLNVGDYVEVWVQCSRTSNINVGSSLSFFEGVKIL